MREQQALQRLHSQEHLQTGNNNDNNAIENNRLRNNRHGEAEVDRTESIEFADKKGNIYGLADATQDDHAVNFKQLKALDDKVPVVYVDKNGTDVGEKDGKFYLKILNITMTFT